MDQTVKALSPAELPEALKAAFAKLYGIDCDLAALKTVHIEPKADERTAQWRDLKAATGIARKDLELYYKLYKRDKDAEQLDDEDAGRQIKDDLRRLYDALQKGETLDWLGVAVGAENEPGSEDEEDDAPLAAVGADEGVDDPAEVGPDDADIEPEADPATAEAEAGPDADWGNAEAEASDAAFDNAGMVFNEGEASGTAGKTPQDNPYTDGIRAATWERGRKAGIRKALEGVGDNVIPMTAAAE